MEGQISQQERARVIEALDNAPQLARVLVALVDAADSSNLLKKSESVLARILAVLPETDPISQNKIVIVSGQLGVASRLTVNEQTLESLLSEGSFNKSRLEQEEYARDLGYRLATREENHTYAESLLAHERAGTLNQAGENALQAFRKRHVRDTAGVLTVSGCDIIADHYVYTGAYANAGFLFVKLIT